MFESSTLQNGVRAFFLARLSGRGTLPAIDKAAWLRCLSTIAVVLLVTAAGFSQSTGNSAISGVVTDPTGAVVPGATVEIH